jgi:hypothetical protein
LKYKYIYDVVFLRYPKNSPLAFAAKTVLLRFYFSPREASVCHEFIFNYTVNNPYLKPISHLLVLLFPAEKLSLTPEQITLGSVILECSRFHLPVAPNLLNQNFTTHSPDQTPDRQAGGLHHPSFWYEVYGA